MGKGKKTDLTDDSWLWSLYRDFLEQGREDWADRLLEKNPQMLEHVEQECAAAAEEGISWEEMLDKMEKDKD